MLLEPQRIVAERYRLLHPLGEGGMGTVWAAHDEREARDVALKFAKDADVRLDRRRRFAREARAAMKIAHKNVVRIYEVVAPEDAAAAGVAPFMVMDRLSGESLQSRIERKGALALAEFATIFVQVLSAVGTAHAMGIVHRDLKPANIFLVGGDAGLEVRVLDFGIAKFAEEDIATASTNLTNTGEMIGTPHYMSPEQIYGERDLDHRTDVWSLGIIAYECLTGSHPVKGDNIGQVFKAVTAARLPSLSVTAPALPASVHRIVDRMLTRDRSQRPSDLQEVFEVFAEYATVRAPTFDRARHSSADVGRIALPETLDDEPARSRPLAPSRRTRAWPLVAAVTAAALAGSLALALRSSPPPTTTSVPAPSKAAAESAIAAPAVPSPAAVAPASVSTTAPTTSTMPPAISVAATVKKAPSPAISDAGLPKKGPHDEDI